jgi:hypothetical protein
MMVYTYGTDILKVELMRKIACSEPKIYNKQLHKIQVPPPPYLFLMKKELKCFITIAHFDSNERDP